MEEKDFYKDLFIKTKCDLNSLIDDYCIEMSKRNGDSQDVILERIKKRSIEHEKSVIQKLLELRPSSNTTDNQ